MEAHAHPWLKLLHQGLQIAPVRSVVAGEKDRGVEAEDLGGAHVIADVLEVDPGRHRGQPGTGVADLPLPPDRIAADLMDVPGVRWRHDATVLAGGAHQQCVGLEGIEAEGAVGTMGLAEAVAKPYGRTGGEGRFELIREHPFPACLSDGWAGHVGSL